MIEIPVLKAFREFLFNRRRRIKKRFVIVYGGAGSGKSFSVALKIAVLCNENPNLQCLVSRKTFPALRITAFPIMIEALNMLGIRYDLHKSSSTITLTNGSTILFKSMDNPEKIKSLNLDLVWLEEATDFTHADFLQINLRLRGTNIEMNQCYLTFNPIDEFHWLNTEMLMKRRKECAVHQSTYRDNIFLPKEYVNELEALKDLDPNHYRIYAEGLFGRLGNIIYSNWDVVENMPSPRYDAYGLDFGFTQPACLVGLVMRDGEPTVKELLYQTNLTNPELIEELKRIINRKAVPIFADPSRPESIAEIAAAGFNIHPAANDVWDGIKAVRARPLHIHKDSVNGIKEIRSYTWRKNKDGRILEEPVKFRDHFMDATRYVIFNYWGKTNIPGSILDIREKLRRKEFDEEEGVTGFVTPHGDLDW